jgi:hypothetical protein
MQRLARNILYTNANAQVIQAEMVPWPTYLLVINIELVLLLLIGVCALFLINRKQKAAIEVSTN